MDTAHSAVDCMLNGSLTAGHSVERFLFKIVDFPVINVGEVVACDFFGLFQFLDK